MWLFQPQLKNQRPLVTVFFSIANSNYQPTKIQLLFEISTFRETTRTVIAEF